jgi:NADPH2:quinone reductase
MRALVAAPRHPGGIEMRDVPEPEPAPHEALVDVRAFSLNRGECVALGGAQDGWRPGWDLAGVVARRAADGTGPGDATRVVGWVNGGAWAERATVRTAHLAALPDEVSFETASTLPVAGLTALAAAERGGGVGSLRVAITGANGGVGRFAIQVAHAEGARVTAVVTAADRAEGLRELGADEIEVELQPTGEPFDVILESVGGPSLAAALGRVAAEGVVVSFGNSSGQATEFDPRAFYRRGSPSMRALFITYELLNERVGTTQLAKLARLVGDGRLRVDIGLTADWRDAASAVSALVERRITGKAVLTTS